MRSRDFGVKKKTQKKQTGFVALPFVKERLDNLGPDGITGQIWDLTEVLSPGREQHTHAHTHKHRVRLSALHINTIPKPMFLNLGVVTP